MADERDVARRGRGSPFGNDGTPDHFDEHQKFSTKVGAQASSCGGWCHLRCLVVVHLLRLLVLPGAEGGP